MTGFLSTLSKPFQLAVLLWPFVSVLLTVPAAVYLYHRDNRLRPVSVLGAYAFMLYVLGLGCFTLYPWPQDPAAYCATHHLGAQLNPLQFIGDIRTDGVTAILQLGMNIVLFVPMGFFLARFFRLPSWVAVAVCCATSVCIEVAQLTGIFHLYPCAYRICDVDDVITNTLGGAVGVALGLWCNRAFPTPRIDKTEVTMHPGFLRRCVSRSPWTWALSQCARCCRLCCGRISGMEQSPLKAARSLCCPACGSCCSKALCHGVPMDAPSAASSPG